MTSPAPQVQYAGIGSVGADQYNTFVQVAANYAQLRGFPALNEMVCVVLGTVSPNDGGQGIFYFSASSTAADNNSTVIAPAGSTQGRWLILGSNL